MKGLWTLSLPKVLYVQHTQERCGVYQWGAGLFPVLQKSTKYDFVFCPLSTAEEYRQVIARYTPSAIIYNHHAQNMPWLSNELMGEFASIKHISMLHDPWQRKFDNVTLAFWPDPTVAESSPYYKCGRMVYAYVNNHPIPDTPTFGSFGFGFGHKHFYRLVDMVQQEYEEAIIRLHMPGNDFLDGDHSRSRGEYERARAQIRKAGIQLEISYDFLSIPALIDRLGQNTANTLFYEYLGNAGTSGAIDYMLAARRPIAITPSFMFRHVDIPEINVTSSSLKQIVARGLTPIQPFIDKWSPENLLLDHERFLDIAFQQEK
jgi:hypothetical protein